MKILVTGGLGFVGSNLVDILVNKGYTVHVLDNLSSESASTDYCNHRVHYHLSDVNDIFNVFPNLMKFDKIFHLAAEARIQPSFDRPLDYFKSNILGTAAVMEYARLSNSGIVVYSTTSSKNHGSIYITPYTYSKVSGEDILKTYAHCYNMNCAMATFYNVYGPREPEKGEWATVVAKFKRQWVSGEQLTVVGDGTQTRDFTHVSDICHGLIKISEGTWKADNFDLGRGMPVSILNLALMYTSNDLSRIDFVPLRKNEGMHTESNCIETENQIQWKAIYNLNTYIQTNK